MPKFHINKRYSNTFTIDADSYALRDEYWTFSDEEGDPVFTLSAKLVSSIERDDKGVQS